ncbi:MAG: VTT domain-containing protein [Mariniblastus sp.]|nr:VTT domain-containing protein [Mariniblastus sp.]
MRTSSIVKLVILMLLVALTGTVLYSYGGRFNEEQLGKLQGFVQGYRPYDEVVYVLACAVAPMIFLPDTICNLIGAEIFPPFWWGALLCSLGVILGSVPSYFIGGALGHDVVSRCAGDRLAELDKRIKRFGFWGMLFFRVAPILPFGVVSYAAGVLKVPFRDYLLATVLGFVPLTFVCQYFFHQVGAAFLNHPFHLNHLKLVNISLALLGVVVVVAVLVCITRKKQSRGGADANAQDVSE